jgi:hypothetical protein
MFERYRILWLAGGGVLLVVLGFIGAYAGDKATREQQATAVPSGTPVDSLEDCPWGDASCVLATSIERALSLGRVDVVVDFAEPSLYDCPGAPPAGPGGPFPLCDGVPEFTRLEGYPIAHRFSEGSVVDKAGLTAFIEDFLDRVNPDASDDVGDGALRLYAFGCPERATPLVNVSCARLAIILSAIVGEGDSAHRELLVFWAVGLFRGETLPVTEVWDGPFLDSERSTLFQTGGFIEDLGEVYVIDQSLRQEPN